MLNTADKVFSTDEGKKVFTKEIKTLIRQRKTSAVKSLIAGRDISYLVDQSGTTLLHLAAKCGNLSLIRHLIDSGCNINAKDIFGRTALMLSVLYNQNAATKRLLEANAGIESTNKNGKSLLEVVLNEQRKLPIQIILCFYQNLKRNGMSSVEIANKLGNAGCSLTTAFFMDDPELTRIMLDEYDTKNEDLMNLDEIKSAMEESSLENVGAIVTHGRGRERRLELLRGEIRQALSEATWKIPMLDGYVEKMIEWNIINEEFAFFLQRHFRRGTKELIGVLMRHRIDDYVMQHYELDLLYALAGNDNPGVVHLLASRQYNVNTTYGIKAESTLHYALRKGLPDNVQVLLELGADPNITDVNGHTPLEYALQLEQSRKRQSVESLLQYGANVQVLVLKRPNIITRLGKDPEMFIAALAMEHSLGIPIHEDIIKNIYSHESVKEQYETCCMQLARIKEEMLYQSITLFEALVSHPKILVHLALNPDITANIHDYCEAGNFHWYYASSLKKRLARALELSERRATASRVLTDCIGMYYGEVQEISEVIVSCLTYAELCILCDDVL